MNNIEKFMLIISILIMILLFVGTILCSYYNYSDYKNRCERNNLLYNSDSGCLMKEGNYYIKVNVVEENGKEIIVRK